MQFNNNNHIPLPKQMYIIINLKKQGPTTTPYYDMTW